MQYNMVDFISGLESLSLLAKRQSLKHRYEGGVGDFDKMSEAERILCITGLVKHADLYSELEMTGVDFTNSIHILKAALNKLNLQLPEGLMDKVLPTDFVEIYSPEFVPLFKTPNFWGTSSYSLDELYSSPYTSLYERSEFFQKKIDIGLKKIFTGESTILNNPVPKHEVWELRGEDRVYMEIKYFSQILDPDGYGVGVVSISEITPIVSSGYQPIFGS